MFVALLLVIAAPARAEQDTKDTSVRKERNYIRQGNKLYGEKRYAEAEVEYRKALQVNQSSEVGMYNLATTLLQIAGTNKNTDDKNNPVAEAARLFADVAGMTHSADLKARSYYNLGNLAFNSEQYDQAVNFYKRSLRANPNDEQCRQNLRLAQLRLQNQDQNQDKKDDKKEEKKEDKKEQQQDQQQPQQQPQQNQQQNQQQQQQQQPQGGMSADNAEQILKAMQNSEQATQKKVNASRSQQQENERRRTRNQW